jgi:hypothetical protein
VRLIEVTDNKTAKEFIRVPIVIYNGDPNWIRPLDRDIRAVFDPGQNKLLRSGQCIRWIATDDGGKLIGRIAAFVNPDTSRRQVQPTGGVGFFESVNDQAAADMLFEASKGWLQGMGMEAMDGPVNFGERDRWWGCLVDGFTEPNYCCNYNPRYYSSLFETYGFQTYYRQFTFSRAVTAPLPPQYEEKAQRIARNKSYSFQHIDKRQLERYAEDFVSIYNKAWVRHHGVGEIKRAHAMAMFKRMKPVIDEDIIWFGYHDREPIAFFIMLPELNQIFRHVNGKLDLLGKLKFLYHKKRGTCRKMFGVVFGIVPEYQGKGVEGALVQAAARHIQPLGRYDIFEMNWIGDFNLIMIKIGEQVGAHVAKTHVTYRYLFDRNKPFERHPMIGKS